MKIRHALKRNYLVHQAGHSLLEMLLVLAILGMLLLMVFPIYPTSASKQEIEFALQQFEEDYLLVQQKVIAEEIIHQIILNPSNSYYYVQKVDPTEGSGSRAKLLFTRHLPQGLLIDNVTNGNTILLRGTGHWHGGTITFAYNLSGKHYRRKYIFQVHTGRFRIDEQVYEL